MPASSGTVSPTKGQFDRENAEAMAEVLRKSSSTIAVPSHINLTRWKELPID